MSSSAVVIHNTGVTLAQYLTASISDDLDNPAANVAIGFDRVDESAGSDITLNVSNGQITVDPGVYLITVSVQSDLVSTSARYQLYDVTGAANVIGGCVRLTDPAGTSNISSGNAIQRIVRLTATNIYEVRNLNGSTGILFGDCTRITVTKLFTGTIGTGLNLYALLRDEKSSGTQGGTFTLGAPRTRDLNTKVIDEIGITLSSDQFTLPAGTYRFSASAPARRVDNHVIRLENISDTISFIGEVCLANSGEFTLTHARVEGQFTITAPKDFEIQHEGQATLATDGFGNAAGFGEIEVYASIVLVKVE